MDDPPPKPLLVVIAGPNGSGKTRWTQELLAHKWLQDCIYINPDEIAETRYADLGGWNSRDATVKALQYASKLRERCLQNKTSFVFETVFSTDEKVAFVRRAIAAGYFVRFCFIATDRPAINAARVTDRIMEGGHTVPLEKIIARYYRSIVNATRVLSEVDRAYVFDNSVDGVPPQRQFRVADGVVARADMRGRHQWADAIRESVRAPLRQPREEPPVTPGEDSPTGPK